jgi:hypothetical protein
MRFEDYVKKLRWQKQRIPEYKQSGRYYKSNRYKVTKKEERYELEGGPEIGSDRNSNKCD